MPKVGAWEARESPTSLYGGAGWQSPFRPPKSDFCLKKPESGSF